MIDRFDYVTYVALLGALGRTHRLLRFRDLLAGSPPGAFCLLRHDVDYSPEAAIRLAEVEADHAIAATYFLLPSSLYYNLLSPEHAAFPRRLTELGHEVGLHYDVNFLARFPREQWPEWVETQAELLARLSGERVGAIAMHQPGLYGADPLREATRFQNAYDPRFTDEMAYFSDSCRAWRDRTWEALSGIALPERIQLVLHPINWSDHDRDRVEIFTTVHRDLAAGVERAGEVLLGQIAVHSGVLEHEARRAREPTGEAE